MSPSWRDHSYHVDVLVMRKAHAEFRDKFSPLQFWIGNVAETRKQPAGSVARRHRGVAIRANGWRRPLAREELWAMTTQARRVFGEISDVLKSSVTFAHYIPILRWNFMT